MSKSGILDAQIMDFGCLNLGISSSGDVNLGSEIWDVKSGIWDL